MSVPSNPDIYHIIHVDKLESIIKEQYLYSDKQVAEKNLTGTNIGMNKIKTRRLSLRLASHSDLNVGECVPFYFCPRSVMLYLIHCKNEELSYKGGQDEILHLVSSLREAIEWAEKENLRWAFTLSNAGSFIFEDRCDLKDIGNINWTAVNSTQWGGQGIDPAIKEGKQAEFLLENKFPWSLVKQIGMRNNSGLNNRVSQAIRACENKPSLTFQESWYY